MSPEQKPFRLEMQERQELTNIVAGLYDFTDGGARGRRVLIEQANLSRFLPGLDLTGDAKTVAGDLIGRLEKFGRLPEQPTYHALGALLSYVLTLGDLPKERADPLAILIVKYSLVADPAYTEKLRNTYGVDVSPSPDMLPPSEFVPPVIKPATEVAPAFDPSPRADEMLEQIINSRDNFLDIYLLMGAIYSAQAVCRIELPGDRALGTGFLIGPDLLLTNYHVLKNEDYVREAIARFDARRDANDVILPGREFKLLPEFLGRSEPEELDYALVRLQDKPLKERAAGAELKGQSLWELMLKGKHRGYLVLSPDFIKREDRVNIIQHPGGDPMKVVMTQNRIIDDMTKTRVQYLADTDHGSSGAPVCNQKWEVVALHHSGGPYPPRPPGGAPGKPRRPPTQLNEGIPIRAIVEDFKAKGLERYLPRE